MKIGIISGHSIANLIKNPEKIVVETAFGNISIEVSRMGKHNLFFIKRHGEKSDIPPHKINYRGNIQAFASSHVKCILSICTVGSMKKSIKPGDFVIPHDFIDFTKSRPQTFFDDKRTHVDMTNPYCPSLRNSLIKNCKKVGGIFHEEGLYLATEGPRLETASEINYFSKFADIVGMTGVPEVVLARERGICYASLCVVCNMAAGFQNKLSADEISKIYNEKESVVSDILQLTSDSIDEKRTCNCKNDLSKATV
ncbi:MAG: MTAP family purine nucleoside phosphorylase [Petrotogales bacterium]